MKKLFFVSIFLLTTLKSFALITWNFEIQNNSDYNYEIDSSPHFLGFDKFKNEKWQDCRDLGELNTKQIIFPHAIRTFQFYEHEQCISRIPALSLDGKILNTSVEAREHGFSFYSSKMKKGFHWNSYYYANEGTEEESIIRNLFFLNLVCKMDPSHEKEMIVISFNNQGLPDQEMIRTSNKNCEYDSGTWE